MSELQLQDPEENEASYCKKSEIHVEVVRDAGKKKEECPMSGSHEWIGGVKDYILHHVCKRCGFESKEMAGG